MQIELKKLQSRVGITFVFVTHDQEEALTMSDRIAVMKQGRIEQLGSPAEIYHRPATKFVATFLGQTNLLHAKILSNNRVRLSDGTELSCDVGNRSIGGEVLLSIRPERISLSPIGDENVIDVELIGRIFKGAYEQFTLRTAGGLELIAIDQSSPCEISKCQLPPTDLAQVV